MKEFKDANEVYQNIPIPDGLEGRVKEGIRQGRAAYRGRIRRRRFCVSAAACFLVLLAGLNFSPTVAHAAANVPVLGKLFQVLSFTSYTKTEDNINYSLSVPQVESNSDLAESVNQVIQDKVDQHLEQARQDWADYQAAFFSTGGTEEEWGGREMDVMIDYEIKFQTGTQLSFVVRLSEGWVSSREEWYCYNLDLAENQAITLQDLLGNDWAASSTAAVQKQIDARASQGEGNYFFSSEDGGFTAVDENTSFYIREDGVPVAVFPRYSIAAGAAGFLEFPLE